jgi:uncharacterized protein YbcC (UPF0753/DUF2309 family)
LAGVISKSVKDAGHILPKQAVLENFVHHNPWEMLQNMDFFEAHAHVRELVSYLSPAERLYTVKGLDPRPQANAALSELSTVFLDLGVAKWEAPNRDKGFLHFFATREGCDFFAPAWRKHARATAEKIRKEMEDTEISGAELAESILEENLHALGVAPKDFTPTIRSMLFELQGWAGMFQRMEDHPAEAPANATVRFIEFAAVQSIFARASVESVAKCTGSELHALVAKAPTQREHCEAGVITGEDDTLQSPSSLAYLDQNSARREALEKEYEATTLGAIGVRTRKKERKVPQSGQEIPAPESKERVCVRPVCQFYTCIDERECSFRRHAEESTGNSDVETFGVAGFFGCQIKYKDLAPGAETITLAPEGARPADTVVLEAHPDDVNKAVWYDRKRAFIARLALIWETASFSPLGSLVLAVLFPFSMLMLFFKSVCPTRKRELEDAFSNALVAPPRTEFALPFSYAEAAQKIAGNMKNIGLKDRFAPIFLILGHGSRTVNNPFDAAHNCGACGGREGGPNARLLARCANHPEVRSILRREYGITIPDDTWFVGGFHDTSSELVDLYDTEHVPASLKAEFEKAKEIVYYARGQNALERCSKFMLFTGSTPEDALSYVHTRSTDLGESRPELGHATNAAVVIGRRELTYGRFYARRAFLPSYDPFNDDDRGSNLEGVITPALVVCSGISLEYLYSTLDGGAGTKVAMNLVGNFGVMQGTSGDLMVGLPTQMTELHSPVRAMYVIDAPVARVQAVLARSELLTNLVYNEWVRFFVRDPYTNKVYRQSKGEYFPVEVNATEGAETYVPFTAHKEHCEKVASYEKLCFRSALAVMLGSCALLIYAFADSAMHPYGALIAGCATLITLPNLAFSRRYLHGEFMFDRFAFLSTLMLLGFNTLALSPDVDWALVGWELLGVSSAFLIGAYSERPTVSENATFVWAVYQLSDCAMLVAAAFSSRLYDAEKNEDLVAFALIASACLKTSQFPFVDLFARSMEGTSPSSALGYAVLSAHAGVVLLSATMPLWFLPVPRMVLAAVGLATAIIGTLVGNIRADRKGSIANVSAATVGLLYVILAAGYADVALVLCFGHAVFRMVQVLRAHNLILDTHNVRTCIGHISQTQVPALFYKLSWKLLRINSDLRLPHLLSRVRAGKPLGLSKFQISFVSCLLVLLTVLPYTRHMHVESLMHTQPYIAALVLLLTVMISTDLMHFVFVDVLDPRRFRHDEPAATRPNKVDGKTASSSLSAPLLAEPTGEPTSPVGASAA